VAVLLNGEQLLGNHRVLNLSAGGALLVGKPPAASGQLEVLLRMSTGKVVRARASVVREESVEESSVFAVEFSGLGGDDAEAIDALVLTAVADEREPTSLVVTTAPEIGQLLRRQLAALGHPTFGVSTLEDAARLLEAPNRLAFVMVDLELGRTRTAEVISYLATKHPGIRRVVLNKPSAKERIAPAMPPAAARLVQAVVPRPWTHDDLIRAIG
jgi:CheY-like chemotaxis protein